MDDGGINSETQARWYMSAYSTRGMDGSELHDLMGDVKFLLNEVDEQDTPSIPELTALLQVRAVAVLAEQVHQTGQHVERFFDLIETLIEPGPSHWQRVKGWMHIKGWLR